MTRSSATPPQTECRGIRRPVELAEADAATEPDPTLAVDAELVDATTKNDPSRAVAERGETRTNVFGRWGGCETWDTPGSP